MKMATSEAGKAAYELGMEICGPYGAGDRRRTRAKKRAAGSTSFFVSFANTIAGGIVGDPAQHHRPARARASRRGDSSMTMDFTLTDDQQLLRDTARKLLDARVPAGARARAHRRPRRVSRRCGSTSREYTALGARPGDRPLPVPRSRPATSPRPDRSSRPQRCSRRSPARTRPARSRSPAPTALGAERRPGEDVRARSRPRRPDRGRRRRARRSPSSTVRPPDALRFVATVDFSRRVFELDTDAASRSTAQPVAPRRTRRGSTARTLRSRPRWSAPRAASSRWRSTTPRNASSSTCRSARSRRSSTSSPRCRSRSSGRPRPCTTRR